MFSVSSNLLRICLWLMMSYFGFTTLLSKNFEMMVLESGRGIFEICNLVAQAVLSDFL